MLVQFRQLHNQPDSLQITTGEFVDTSANYWSDNSYWYVDITWSADILGITAYQTGNVGNLQQLQLQLQLLLLAWGTDGCTDNIKVWEIDPSPNFHVLISITSILQPFNQLRLMMNTVTQCVDEVQCCKV